ncbi:MAG: hypothetical protein K2P98_06040 [Neisseriaceae bacterium]|nr:hypothetical protein [Neisseriaceae bacterium]
MNVPKLKSDNAKDLNVKAKKDKNSGILTHPTFIWVKIKACGQLFVCFSSRNKEKGWPHPF